jgi:hypothetical protein
VIWGGGVIWMVFFFWGGGVIREVIRGAQWRE